MAYKDPLDPRNRAARRKHYHANKQQYLDRNAAAKVEKQAYVRAAREAPCHDCGNSFPWYVMEFDHRDPAQKVACIGQLVGYGWRKLLAEIEKCDLVCANCHKIRTHVQREGGLFKRGSLPSTPATPTTTSPSPLSRVQPP